jgi:hypothetical protein
MRRGRTALQGLQQVLGRAQDEGQAGMLHAHVSWRGRGRLLSAAARHRSTAGIAVRPGARRRRGARAPIRRGHRRAGSGSPGGPVPFPRAGRLCAGRGRGRCRRRRRGPRGRATRRRRVGRLLAVPGGELPRLQQDQTQVGERAPGHGAEPRGLDLPPDLRRRDAPASALNHGPRHPEDLPQVLRMGRQAPGHQPVAPEMLIAPRPMAERVAMQSPVGGEVHGADPAELHQAQEHEPCLDHGIEGGVPDRLFSMADPAQRRGVLHDESLRDGRDPVLLGIAVADRDLHGQRQKVQRLRPHVHGMFLPRPRHAVKTDHEGDFLPQ